MNLSTKQWLSVLKLGTSCGINSDGEEPTKGAPYTVIQVPLTHAHVIDVDDEESAMATDTTKGSILAPLLLAFSDVLIWTDRGLQVVQLAPPPESLEVVEDAGDLSLQWSMSETHDLDFVLNVQDPNFVKFSLKRGFWAMRTHGKTTNEPRTACALTQRGKAFAAAWSQLAKSAKGNDLDPTLDP